MFLFGITGGIGSGKSTVGKLLKAKGVPIIEADPLAKDLTNQLPAIREALIREFGEDVYGGDGTLNRTRLSQLVFTDSGSRNRVNEIVHPHVLQAIKDEARRLEEEENQSLIGVEAALIFESRMEAMLKAVVVVNAAKEDRILRIAERDGLGRESIKQRMDSQMSVSEKVSRADYVVQNVGSPDDLESEVEALYEWLASQQ